MFQSEPLYLLPVPDMLASVVAVVVLSALLVILVEIGCLFCALLSGWLGESGHRRDRRVV
ncbi:MAG: hypothetical protein GTO46_14115 [Gemmatimonadetes bacterium]|nr:hypothetical protein [Gemmatimonadota bacterium]NIO32725.1 hypothetical protein [Gemmatimonadota bacterium]